jgi:hypothetical protein
VNENSLILSLFNPFVSSYRAQSTVYIFMGFIGHALSPRQDRPQKIQDILTWRDWDSKLQAIQEKGCLHPSVCRWLLMVKIRVLSFK